MRDPLNNLSFVFKKRYERAQTQRKNPRLLLALYDHVHPDLSVNTNLMFIYVLVILLNCIIADAGLNSLFPGVCYNI